MNSSYFPVHAHSQYSTLDGMGTVQQMVQRVARLGQPALALTDHGSMAGVVRLYKECMKEGIAPYPGSEFYLVQDIHDPDARGKRMHLGILALDETGFKALNGLSTLSHQQFYRKPIIDWRNLADLSTAAGDHVAVTTGCRSGPVVSALLENRNPQVIVARLRKYFKHTFIEVQDHGVEDVVDDGELCTALFGIASDMSLPVVLGQDSHYVFAEHQAAHDMMKSICYFGDSDDWKFDGGPYHLAGADELAPEWGKQWDVIEQGHEALLDLNHMKLPALDKYKFYVPQIGNHSLLKLKVRSGMEERDLDTWTHYEQQINREMKVIEQMGFSSYFMLMQNLLNWARQQGIFFNVRGSANGSLVCYVLGITNVDPIKWGLSFDRFLSLDRKKPPDIDVDVESSRRIEFIEHIKTKFPTSVPIGTYSQIGMTEDAEDDRKGSLVVQYMAAHRRKDPGFDGKVAKEDWPALEALSVIPARKSAGVHAAGYILPSAELPIDDYLAVMYIPSSKTFASQAPMEDVEDAGYVKGDFLGLKALETFRKVIESLGKDPVTDGMEWIPDDDREACKQLRSGRTGTGIFQYEGFSTAKGGRELGVRSTYDAILGLALYRPAMMDSGMTAKYIAARKSKTFQKLHPMIDALMKNTWGVPVFQEQVISIMRTVGLGFEDLNDILKAVKASNGKIGEYAESTFRRVHPIFIRSACQNLDCDRDKAEEIWRTVMSFSDYGFAAAHATSYGLMSYRMAWLKAHHPNEFMAALLATWAGTKKEPVYVAEARRMGISIARADINRSGVLWAIDERGNLRRGLLSIKGVGEAAARTIIDIRDQDGPYTSIEDLISRVPARPVSGGREYAKTGMLKGVLETLASANAFRSLGVQRD